MSGFGDPRFRFSINLFGTPALSFKEYASYRQDLIAGASLQITAPLGQYGPSRLINLGNNRWSFKPRARYNADFNSGHRFAQAPLYEVQGHLTYSFPSGVWVALNGTYFAGNRTTVDGVREDSMQQNTRAGLPLALPMNRHNSVKLYASTGTSSHTGSNFNAVGLAVSVGRRLLTAALFKAIAVAKLILATDGRTTRIDGAQHRAAIKRCTPAVVETTHHPPTPLVFFGQVLRRLIVAHQHHLEPTAAGLATGARNADRRRHGHRHNPNRVLTRRRIDRRNGKDDLRQEGVAAKKAPWRQGWPLRAAASNS